MVVAASPEPCRSLTRAVVETSLSGSVLGAQWITVSYRGRAVDENPIVSLLVLHVLWGFLNYFYFFLFFKQSLSNVMVT